jgi:CBS domain containing-hemolysin-like protein
MLASIGPNDVATGAGTAADWFLLVFYLLLALGVSFICSLLEAGLLSITRPYIAVLRREGRVTGERLEKMKQNIDRPLAAILTLNTVAHTIGAAGVGAQVVVIFGSAWVAAGSVVVTLLILVLSEIIPKTLGAVHARPLAGFTARTIAVIMTLTYPLVVVLELISRRLGGGKAATMTREEIEVVADIGERAGALREDESRVIRNLLRLHEVKVQDIMTPRPVVFSLSKDATVGEVIAAHQPIPFSRIPVYDESPDRMIGLVLRLAILEAAKDGRRDQPVGELAESIEVIPEVSNVDAALDRFIARQAHFFQVVDEFGGTAGIVTLEDAVETLLGVEIVDETDSVTDMREHAREMLAKRQRRKREARGRNVDRSR